MNIYSYNLREAFKSVIKVCVQGTTCEKLIYALCWGVIQKKYTHKSNKVTLGLRTSSVLDSTLFSVNTQNKCNVTLVTVQTSFIIILHCSLHISITCSIIGFVDIIADNYSLL